MLEVIMVEQLTRWVSEQTSISDETLMKCVIFMLGVVSKWGLGKLKAMVWKEPPSSDESGPVKSAINRCEVYPDKNRPALVADYWDVSESNDKTFFPRKLPGKGYQRVPHNLSIARLLDMNCPSKGKLTVYLAGAFAGRVYLGKDQIDTTYTKKDRQEVIRDAWLAYRRAKDHDADLVRRERRESLGLPS